MSDFLRIIPTCSTIAQNLARCENVPIEWHCSSFNHRNSFCIRLCPTSEQVQENPSHEFIGEEQGETDDNFETEDGDLIMKIFEKSSFLSFF